MLTCSTSPINRNLMNGQLKSASRRVTARRVIIGNDTAALSADKVCRAIRPDRIQPLPPVLARDRGTCGRSTVARSGPLRASRELDVDGARRSRQLLELHCAGRLRVRELELVETGDPQLGIAGLKDHASIGRGNQSESKMLRGNSEPSTVRAKSRVLGSDASQLLPFSVTRASRRTHINRDSRSANLNDSVASSD